MTSSGDGGRWARLEELCVAALRVPEGERDDWLRLVTDGDTELEAEARGLLRHHDPDFLAEPVSTVHDLALGSLDATHPEGVSAGRPPERFGDGPDAGGPLLEGYRLIRPLGRGGMGDVYLASREGDDYRRFVAIKVIRKGLDSEDVVARFRRERKILSSLTHPNICALIDGGLTDDGRPYFVMEHVDGVDLSAWVSTADVDLRDRVEVFLRVAAAVQHAHRSLVIHRDLKPANILVTPGGSAKLLDFGIAKVLHEERDDDRSTFRTQAGAQVLTPEYAAPEQLSGEPVTTATDIYSLGVVLYELITGAVPPSPGTDRERHPPPPSHVPSHRGPQAAGADRDLDVITMKALEVDPFQRYASVAAMVEDLQRWLDGRPILARPSTWRYRTRKFIQRRPWAAATAAAAVVALLSLGAVPWVAAQRAEVERDRALEIQSFLLEMFGATGGDQAVGDTVTARGLLDRQAQRVDRLYADEPDVHASMLRVLGEGYDRLGLANDAEVHARAALALEREHDGLSPDGLAASLNLLGWIRHQQGDAVEARGLLEEAVARRRDEGGRYRSELARSLNDLAVVLDAEGEYERSAGLHREAFQIRMDEEGIAGLGTAVSANNLAVAHYRDGDFEGAEEYGGIALESLRRSLGPDHQRSVIAQNNLAAFRIAGGDLEGARQVYVDLLDRQTRLQGRNHPVTTGVMGSLATVEILLGDGAAAEPLMREALEIEAQRWGPGDPRSGETLRLLGRSLVLQDRFDEGIQALRQAMSDLEELLGPEHREVAATEAAIAQAYELSDRLTEALEWQTRVVDSYTGSYGPDHPETVRQVERLRQLRESAPSS